MSEEYTLFLFLQKKHRMWVLIRTVSPRQFYRVPTFYILSRNMKNIRGFFVWKFSVFFFFEVKFSIYLNRCVFSSPELCSGWAIVITFRPSSVRLCVRASIRPSMHPSVNIFKWLLLWNGWANFAQISYGASLGWGNEKLLKWSRSVDQDGRHAHIW